MSGQFRHCGGGHDRQHATTGGRAGVDSAASQTRAAADEDAESPWLWRKDWASGRVKDGAFGKVAQAWAVALFFSILCGIFVPVFVLAIVNDGAYRILWAAPVLLIGPFMLGRALLATVRYARFGGSTFELETLPGVIGHGLSGRLRTRTRAADNEPFRATLSCLRVIENQASSNKASDERLLWQQEQRVVGERAGGRGATLVPTHVEPTDETGLLNQIVWRLTVTLDIPGIDYRASFEVPVFRTGASETPQTTAETGSVVSPWAKAAARLD